MSALSFELPPGLEAGEPPAVRDAVRLMVARSGRPLVHASFLELPRHLRRGDLLVVNASATLPAALPARLEDGTAVDLHLSTPEPPPGDSRPDRSAPSDPRPDRQAPRDSRPDRPPPRDSRPDRPPPSDPRAHRPPPSDPRAHRPPPSDPRAHRPPPSDPRAHRPPPSDPRTHRPAPGDPRAHRPPPGDPRRWVVELRRDGERLRAATGGRVELPAGAHAELLASFLTPGRLWVAALHLPEPLDAYLTAHGRPIRYAHETRPRPLADHQTIFAAEPGSAEMPSAGRPFTRRALAGLEARGVGIADVVLHAGVSSLERGERPYPERYRVGSATAARVNATHAAGGRVVAVGTTVVRALETVAAPDGSVRAGAGWTSLTVAPERGVRAVDGLLTGWHEPDASHLLMLEAIAGRALLERSYTAALACRYRWHEFGDLHLLLR